jgi:hypothetical protein
MHEDYFVVILVGEPEEELSRLVLVNEVLYLNK